VTRDPLSVFINVPFDDAYDPLLEALIFAIQGSGYKVRCALEENDSGDIRLDKLARLIGESPRSIHDLSRVVVPDLPRFNMPFELGMVMGAKRYSRSRKRDRVVIMVNERFQFPAYLSDLAGNDTHPHNGNPHNVIGVVRDFLDHAPNGRPLPGRAALVETFDQFKRELPDIAHVIRHRVEEVHVRRNYRAFIWCVTEFLKRAG